MGVNVVPMFAPSVMGGILCQGSTPDPHSGVKADVVTELDWTTMVMPTQINIANNHSISPSIG